MIAVFVARRLLENMPLHDDHLGFTRVNMVAPGLRIYGYFHMEFATNFAHAATRRQLSLQLVCNAGVKKVADRGAKGCRWFQQKFRKGCINRCIIAADRGSNSCALIAV